MTIQQWNSNDVKKHIASHKSLQIIDVRQPGEYASGHIPSAKLIPLNELAARYKEIDPNVDTVVVCQSGGRSSQACDFLSRQGYQKIHNLNGGMMFWDGEVQ